MTGRACPPGPPNRGHGQTLLGRKPLPQTYLLHLSPGLKRQWIISDSAAWEDTPYRSSAEPAIRVPLDDKSDARRKANALILPHPHLG
jgi:hypothetical protein